MSDFLLESSAPAILQIEDCRGVFGSWFLEILSVECLAG
jgi:hypothetical protein